MADKNMASNEEIARAAVALIKQEKTAWDTATAFITDRVAFQMRNLIRMMRRNYYGVFEEPNDPNTGRPKIWAPLTEYMVEAAVKNIDLDTKDISLRAKNAEARPLAKVLRAAMAKALNKMNFGEFLDMAERQLAIDGTIVWKTTEETDKEGKKYPQVHLVDILNFYIDPTVDSIAKAEAVIERALMMPEEIMKMDGWVNRTVNEKPLAGTFYFNRYDAQQPNIPSTVAQQVSLREVWERWGVMPKWYITGNKETDKEQIEGHIVVSSSGTDWVTHLVEENLKGRKPYEEAWYTKIHGRWYGKGVAEKVMNLQLYLNIVLNTRINRAIVQQLGLFKIKRGSNITPAIFSRLSAQGGIPVNNMDDIQPLELAQSGIADSINDEKGMIDWAQKVTSLYEASTGDSMPASQPATTSAIQNQAAKSQFTLIKEGIGMFLERWLKNQSLPIIVRGLDQGEVLCLTEDVIDLEEFDEFVVNKMVYKQIDKMSKAGQYVDPQEVLEHREREMLRMRKSGKERYVKLDEDFDVTEYDVEILITNEKIDKSVLMQNLIQLLQFVDPQYQSGIIAEIGDLTGIDLNDLKSATQVTPQQQPAQPGQPQQGGGGAPQGQPGMPQQQPFPTAQQPMQAALTMQNGPQAR